jgi:two-component system response regulator RpaA
MSKVYRTGEIAKMFRVSAHTVAKWVDTGLLKGYRLPGSQDRRIKADDLREFLIANDMPTDEVPDVADELSALLQKYPEMPGAVREIWNAARRSA